MDLVNNENQEYDNFDMTLEECRLVFDAIDNLVIINEKGRIKYLSPNMYKVCEAYNKKPIDKAVAGKHISEIHPATKILNAINTSNYNDISFYFVSDVTNIAKIKSIYNHGKLFGAIDYDIFSDGIELKEFLSKISEYSEKGFINLQDTFQSMYETSRKQKNAKYCVTDIIGKSQSMKSLRMRIGQISESTSTVLITGKTGCGKEIVAHSVHNLSLRCKKPMVEINCAAIPETLFESELFGYEDGSFTGAKKGGKIGKFEMANNGTIFLDEIDQLPYHIQPKLLRVLQEREVVRIGGVTKPIDIRVIAATNKDLWKMVAEGKFREDLYYRLNVVEIKIPELKDRVEDIEILAYYQLKKLNKEFAKDVSYISKEVISMFHNYDWPGNVRELNNILEHAMNVCTESTLRLEHLGSFVSKVLEKHSLIDYSSESPLEIVRLQAEAEAIKKTLELTKNNKTLAAKILKISRTTLYDKICRFKIE